MDCHLKNAVMVPNSGDTTHVLHCGYERYICYVCKQITCYRHAKHTTLRCVVQCDECTAFDKQFKYGELTYNCRGISRMGSFECLDQIYNTSFTKRAFV